MSLGTGCAMRLEVCKSDRAITAAQLYKAGVNIDLELSGASKLTFHSDAKLALEVPACKGSLVSRPARQKHPRMLPVLHKRFAKLLR